MSNYIEKKYFLNEKLRIVFNFDQIKKSKQVVKRLDKFDKKFHEQKKGKLRENLDLGEYVLLLSERMKKKSASEKFYKSSVKKPRIFQQRKCLCYIKQKKYRRKDILLAH